MPRLIFTFISYAAFFFIVDSVYIYHLTLRQSFMQMKYTTKSHEFVFVFCHLAVIFLVELHKSLSLSLSRYRLMRWCVWLYSFSFSFMFSFKHTINFHEIIFDKFVYITNNDKLICYRNRLLQNVFRFSNSSYAHHWFIRLPSIVFSVDVLYISVRIDSRFSILKSDMTTMKRKPISTRSNALL